MVNLISKRRDGIVMEINFYTIIGGRREVGITMGHPREAF